MRRISAALMVMVVLTAGLLAGCGKAQVAPSVRPTVRADGSYRVGSGVGNSAADAAIKAAVAALPVALSYDFRSLDRSLAAATRLMTTSFGATFRHTFDATTRVLATQKQAITSALVRGAGIVGTVHGGKATVLIYLDQVLISSKDRPAGAPLKVSQNRVHVVLREVSGHWLVDDIEPF